MKPRTAIDWALDVIARSKLPPDITGDDLNRHMMELRLISTNGVTEGSLYCPSPGCKYNCEAPSLAEPEDPVICPVHSTTLVIQTWKQMAGRAMEQGFQQAAEFDRVLSEVQTRMDDMSRTILTMRERLAEAETNLDNHRFTTATEQEELEALRDWRSGPAGGLACRVGERLDRSPEPKPPGKDDLNRWAYFHLLKLRLALAAGRRMAVTELAADIATLMLQTTELYGEP